MMKKLKLAIALLIIALIACSGGSDSPNDTSNVIPPDQPINCPDTPLPTMGLYAWAYGGNPWVLVVEQQPCDGFRDYDILAVFREYNPDNGYYNETYDWWLGSGGCYAMKLAIWQNLGQPCSGELWCNNPNACIEFRAMDKITGAIVYRAYAVPGIVNHEYVY